MDGVNANWLGDGPEKWGSAHGHWRVSVVPETGSTNADLLAVIGFQAPDRVVLRTDHQTAGRGRLGRSWEAPAGANLLVSILRREVIGPAHRMTQFLGMACALVLRDDYGVDAALKWPNDVVVTSPDGEFKIAGILAQASNEHAARGVDVVIGMGVNVGWAPPPEIAPATCVAKSQRVGSRTATPHELLLRVLDKFDELELMNIDEAFATYKSLLSTLGKQVRCEMPDGSHVTGRAVDVEIDGRLQIIDECAVTHRVDAGDVVHLRRTD
jgi:BirA family transcriptional regulator, biotin operon repressor / biotin---[acetyl-CoA-carboxylase] ligase